MNGVFIVIVFISHLRTYMTLNPLLDQMMRSFSQLMVATFLFYSGYGVMESVKKKGMSYVRRIPLHRVLGVLAIFVPAVLLYALLDLLLGIPFSGSQFFLSLIAWKNLGNSNWYIFVILCLYLITCVGWMLADLIVRKCGRLSGKGTTSADERRDVIGWVITAVLTVGLVVALKYTTPNYYYNTITAYLFGLFFSINKEHILRACGIDSEERIRSARSVLNYILMTGFMIVTTVVLRHYIKIRWNDYVFMLMTVFFCMGVVLISYLIPFPDRVFRWLGDHLFEVYILMRIPMIAFLRIPGFREGGLWYAVSCLAVTVVLAAGYHYLVRLTKTKIKVIIEKKTEMTKK